MNSHTETVRLSQQTAMVGDCFRAVYWGGSHSGDEREFRVVQVHDDSVLVGDITFGGVKKLLYNRLDRATPIDDPDQPAPDPTEAPLYGSRAVTLHDAFYSVKQGDTILFMGEPQVVHRVVRLAIGGVSNAAANGEQPFFVTTSGLLACYDLCQHP